SNVSVEDYHKTKLLFAEKMIDNFEKATGVAIKDYIEENVFFDGDLTNEDKLLTTLVTVAPEKVSIRFHKEYENEEIKRTIKLIFGERVKFL
ncbi:MAG: sporulation protein YtxC, partial [Clostridia bacterium]|nr:sporulation protein YtxC [Clostridia bacterium]